MLRMCLHKKVLLTLGAVAMGTLIAAPRLFGAALPILLLAVCPLSMLLMMKAMGGGTRERGKPVAAEPSIAELEARLDVLRAKEASSENVTPTADRPAQSNGAPVG